MGHAVTEETWVRVSEPGGNKVILLDFCCTPGRRPGRIFIFSGLIPAATVTLLHVRMTPTPVGKVVALLHVRENAAAPVGAGAWHGQKWSPEAKNEQACCQQGPLDGRTEAGPTEQNNIMRSHGTFLHFAV